MSKHAKSRGRGKEPKRAWQPPALTRYGTIADMTRGSSGSAEDNNNATQHDVFFCPPGAPPALCS